jgi:2-polyprenyl-3-methyl-5-hydroxy-6-metoxy-1,4-benzoquinol methylase
MKCKICKNERGNKEFRVREMMFGFRDEFIYFQCTKCGCLQIKEIPENISKYYTPNYYSFNVYNKSNSIIKRFIKRLSYYAIFNKGTIGKLFYRNFPNISLRSLSRIKPKKNIRILDIGCGSGSFLCSLREFGFKNLYGIDPYIKTDIHYKNGVNIFKKNINEIKGKYDLIMFHHSFEHISDPFEALFSIKKLLSSNGICLIRIPMVDSWAWENYRENWVQIDAPRHFFLHSRKSIEILVKNTGFKIEEIIYDSTEFQFWGSEQYKRDISLNDNNSYVVNPKKSVFLKKEITIFKEKAKELNLKEKGDQAAFYLKYI